MIFQRNAYQGRPPHVSRALNCITAKPRPMPTIGPNPFVSPCYHFSILLSPLNDSGRTSPMIECRRPPSFCHAPSRSPNAAFVAFHVPTIAASFRCQRIVLSNGHTACEEQVAVLWRALKKHGEWRCPRPRRASHMEERSQARSLVHRGGRIVQWISAVAGCSRPYDQLVPFIDTEPHQMRAATGVVKDRTSELLSACIAASLRTSAISAPCPTSHLASTYSVLHCTLVGSVSVPAVHGVL